MPVGMLGRKVGMSQIYNEKGLAIPVTVMEVGPNTVLQVRSPELDGYHAIQLGFVDKKRKSAIRSERGHVANLESKRSKAAASAGKPLREKANCEPQRYIREWRMVAAPEQKVGDKVTVKNFEGVAAVDVIGITKGRGTTGVMKRYNFGGLPASHGVKRHHRAAGSQAAHATDRGNSGKKKKGKKMAGQYGNERVTVRNLKVVRIDEESNLLLVKGAIPGGNNGFVMVRPTNKKRKAVVAKKK